MIQLWNWPIPNGYKMHIMLEEPGLPCDPVPVNTGAGVQFKPGFLAVTRNHRSPAMIDPEGPTGPIALFESGAMLIYLAEKTGHSIATDPLARDTCLNG